MKYTIILEDNKGFKKLYKSGIATPVVEVPTFPYKGERLRFEAHKNKGNTFYYKQLSK